MYKLIALDMDDTLLNGEKRISAGNFTAIKNAKKNGTRIVIASGRSFNGIKRYLKQLELENKDDYAVIFNGAIVQNAKTSEKIEENILNRVDLHALYDLNRKFKVNIHIVTYDYCLTEKWNKYSQIEADQNQCSLKIEDFSKIDKTIAIVKIMFVDDKEKIDIVIENLPENIYGKYTIVRSAPYFLEFLNKKVSKGFGVSVIAKKLGIRREEIICIGDAGNDTDMIKYAGLGIAMGNAFPELKKTADYVTKTNDDDGVAYAINKFVLKKD